jgi:hypothetical protein
MKTINSFLKELKKQGIEFIETTKTVKGYYEGKSRHFKGISCPYTRGSVSLCTLKKEVKAIRVNGVVYGLKKYSRWNSKGVRVKKPVLINVDFEKLISELKG